MAKKMIALVLTFLLVVSLNGCSQAVPKNPLQVTLVVSDSFGDRAFNDSAKMGCDALVDTWEISLDTIECHGAGYSDGIRQAADTADLVILLGSDFSDIDRIAPEYPNVHFIWVDALADVPAENVMNIVFAQNEGAFLAGFVAARMSETGVIGAVGGADNATIQDFLGGYQQGALYANETVQVEIAYTNSYSDAALGKAAAEALYEKDADVIFQVTGGAGEGVFAAAEELGFYAVGVDADQKYLAPQQIICSVMKQVGDAVYQAVSSYIEDSPQQWWGSTWVADMADGYIGIGYGDADMTQQVSDEIKSETGALANDIIAGKLQVETTRSRA